MYDTLQYIPFYICTTNWQPRHTELHSILILSHKVATSAYCTTFRSYILTQIGSHGILHHITSLYCPQIGNHGILHNIQFLYYSTNWQPRHTAPHSVLILSHKSEAVFRFSDPLWAIAGPSELWSKQSCAEPDWDVASDQAVFDSFLPSGIPSWKYL